MSSIKTKTLGYYIIYLSITIFLIGAYALAQDIIISSGGGGTGAGSGTVTNVTGSTGISIATSTTTPAISLPVTSNFFGGDGAGGIQNSGYAFSSFLLVAGITGANTTSAGVINSFPSSASHPGLVTPCAAEPSIPVSGETGCDATGNPYWYGGVFELKLVSQNLTGTTNLNPPVLTGTATLTQVVASGTTAMPTGALSGNACSASATTATATNSLTSDSAEWTYASDPTGVTGYGGGTSGGITIRPWITANTVNFKLCNETSGSITPGALSVNWRVVR